MNFHKWFNKQSVLIKAILLLLPVVGWVCECLIRFSVMQKKKEPLYTIVFLVFIFIGWGWILGAIDFVYMLVTGHLILAD